MHGKAKKSSLVAMIVATIWIIGWSAYTFIFNKDIAIMDIVISALAIAGIYAPTYISMYIDKIKGLK